MKKIIFLIVLISPIICNGQEYVKVKTSIPSNNANNAQGEKCAVWRNNVMAPSTSDNFPNNQNWWTILQTQFHDTRCDAQLAFGINKKDLWLRFNSNDTWRTWKKIVLEDENGNVGIGTSAPKEKLDVRGNIYMNSGTNSNHIFWFGHHMTMGTKPGDYYHNTFSLKPGGASQGNLVSRFQMYTTNSDFQETLKVRIHSEGNSFFNGGNVGIGTTAPKEKLDIRGNIYINSGVDDNHIYWGSHYMTMGTRPGDYAHNVFSLKPGGASQGNLVSKFQMYTVSSNFQETLKVLVNTAGSSFFNGGNVGIGTTSPIEKLDIRNGNLMVYKNSIKLLDKNNSTSDGMGLEYIDGASMSIFSDGVIHFKESDLNSTEVFFNLNEGKVGIGTTTPDYKLDVNGVIRAKEIKVETDWYDFVFEKDYNLRSLEDLESYIAQNKHLPDIPSESEVKENGINLGEINAKLLQKIEELTLYVIEQNKKNKMLQSQLNKQSIIIKQLQNK